MDSVKLQSRKTPQSAQPTPEQKPVRFQCLLPWAESALQGLAAPSKQPCPQGWLCWCELWPLRGQVTGWDINRTDPASVTREQQDLPTPALSCHNWQWLGTTGNNWGSRRENNGSPRSTPTSASSPKAALPQFLATRAALLDSFIPIVTSMCWADIIHEKK